MNISGMASIEERIRQEALSIGFSHCGFATCEPLDGLRARYREYLNAGDHADMAYLERYFEKRMDPRQVLEGARSVVAVLLNYYPEELIPEENNFIIARYACGRDYHPVMRERLEQLSEVLAGFGARRSKSFVDSGPVMEKEWARRCGLGWQGKNTLLINPEGGSFFFIGIILTDLELQPDKPIGDRCGSCSLCREACPAQALDRPYRLSTGSCISYLTIEHDGEIPPEMAGRMNNRIYGCDICQDVCPFNRRAVPAKTPEFTPSERLTRMKKEGWQSLSEEDFNDIFSNTSVKRAGYKKLMRNIRSAT